MKTSNPNNSNSQGKRRVTRYLCVAVVLCFFSLAALQAQEPVRKTPPPANTEQGSSQKATTRESRQEFETQFENVDQKSNQLFNILSNVLKSMKEMKSSSTRNML